MGLDHFQENKGFFMKHLMQNGAVFSCVFFLAKRRGVVSRTRKVPLD
jgi:hypothetical protein